MKYLLLLLLLTKVSRTVFGVGCYVDDGFQFDLAPGFDPKTLTGEACQDACTRFGPTYTLAGITNGHVCLCGKGTVDTLTLISPSFCNMTCTNSDPCGGPLGFLSVYESVSNKPEFVNFTLTQDAASVTIDNINTGGIQCLIYYEIGHGSIPVLLSNIPSLPIPPIIIPLDSLTVGATLVTVYASSPDGSVVVSSTEMIDIERPSQPLKASCPPVAEPNIPYRCGFASIPGSGNLTVKYDGTDAYQIHPFSVEKLSFGNMPPRKEDFQNQELIMELPGAILEPTVLANGKASSYTKIVFVEWHGGVLGSPIELYIFEPSCSLAAGGDYNPTNGFCEAPKSREISVNRGFGTDYGCQTLSFQSMYQDCFAESCSDTNSRCQVENSGLPDTFTPVLGPITIPGTKAPDSDYYYHYLTDAEEMLIAPGQMLGFGGAQVGYISDSSNVDKVASTGFASNGSHFIRFVGFKPEFLWFENTCETAYTDVLAELTDDTATVSVSNMTKCQDPIENLSVILNPGITLQKPEWNPITYVQTTEPLTIIINTDRGLPMTYNISTGGQLLVSEEVTIEAEARSISFVHNYADAGTETIDITLENLHSEEEYGHVKYIHNASKIVIAQDPVLDEFNEGLLEHWLLTDQVDFLLTLDSGLRPPTEPYYNCSWGDGLEDSNVQFNEDVNRENDGSLFNYHIRHSYELAGVYDVSCTLYNFVSFKEFSKTITIYEPIANFEVGINYYEKVTNILRTGLGSKKDKVPLGQNTTFSFDFLSGTIEKLIVVNKTNEEESLIGEFQVTNMFAAKEFLLNIMFETEGVFNVTIQPWSTVEPSYQPLWVQFEVVGQVQGLKIDDFRIITNKEETKRFEVTFDSVGAGTCLVIDYDDGFKLAYGYKEYCQSWPRGSTATFVDGYETIESPFNIDHIYYEFGMFNVSAYAMNFVTEVETWDEMMVIVTSAPCSPPEVTIPINSTVSVAPLKYKRSEAISISGMSKLNCSDVVSTLKKWYISKVVVNSSNLFEEETVLNMLEIAPETMDKAELIIPARSLGYGVYKLRFFSRMWDERPSDPMWTRKLPFERDAYTYIEIIPSNLTAKLIEATVDLITRGKGQSVALEPYLFSFDPDYPELESQNMEFHWFCKMIDEEYPVDDNGVKLYDESNLLSIPEYETPVDVNGGCFGGGPGAINQTQGLLMLQTLFFHKEEQLYEILLDVKKNTFDYKPGFVRVSSKILHLMVISGVPPVMSIHCADPALCFTDAQGDTFINPSSRLALKAWCILDDGSDCSDPMTYEWTVTLPDGTALNVEEFSPTGLENSEFALAADFFNQYPDQEKFFVGLKATNGLGSMGQTMLYVHLNKLPIDGTCTVSPLYGISMMDTFQLLCEDWQDPDNIGIKNYLITSSTNGQAEAAVAEAKMFDPNAPLELFLGTGVHEISVTIEDNWGGQTIYKLESPVVVDPIDPSSFQDFMKSGKLEELVGSGDKGALLMVLQAQAQVIADSDEPLMPVDTPLFNIPGLELTEEDIEYNKAVVKGQLKVDALNMLNDTLAAVTKDLPTAQIVAKTLESLIGDPPYEDEKSDIGLEATKSASELLQQLANSLESMEVADPSQLVPTMTSMTSAVGTLLENIMKTSNIFTTEDSTADELCPQLAPIDIKSADKSGVVEYDTDIGDNVDMKVPLDPQAQRCGGIIDAAKLTGEQVGQDLLEMLTQMSHTLLAKSVVNERQVIETPSITIYAKMTLGEEMGKPHYLGNSADAPWVKFPEKFCLEPLRNDTCKAPAGVSAVVYDTNPLGSLPSSPRLSKDTKMIELSVSNRANVVMDVTNVLEDSGREGIQFLIPRTNRSRESLEMPTAYNISDAFEKFSRNNSMKFMMHLIEIDKIHVDSAMNIEFYPNDIGDNIYALLLDHDHIPIPRDFEHVAIVSLNSFQSSINTSIKWISEGDGGFQWFISNDAVANRTGKWILTVLSLDQWVNVSDFKPENLKIRSVVSGDYSVRTFHSGCYYFNRKQFAWVADDVKVSQNEYSNTLCRSSHLTSFAAGFFHVPNTIDFEFVFAQSSFTDNMTIYMTIIVCLLLYLLLSIWAIWADLKDAKELKSFALPDNNMKHKYFYEILTLTGPWDGSSCDSAVYFELSGDNGSTGQRQLDIGRKDTFRKGTVDSFIMASPKPLGNLNLCRIWHDNSGRDKYGSWFLSSLVVIDIQTNQRTEFNLNRWLAAEKEDGAIERIIQASGSRTCEQMIGNMAEKHFREDHVWFSIFFKSKRSRYTRCQRTSTAFALLFLSMLADIMWYGTVPEEVTDTGLTLGFLTFNLNQAYVGVMVALVTILPALVIGFMFKKSKRRKLRENRISKALKSESISDSTSESSSSDSEESSASSSDESSDSETSDSEDSSSDSDETTVTVESEKTQKKYRKILLPFFFRYLAWFLCFVSIGASCFFLISYGITFGNDKTHQWLTSMVVCFFFSIIFLDPIKIGLISCCLSGICKYSNTDLNVDVEDDETDPEIYDSSEWNVDGMDPLKAPQEPIDEVKLDLIRIKKQKELAIWSIVKELSSFFVFILIVFLINYINRDLNSYRLQNQLKHNFIVKNGFDKIKTSNDWWKWIHVTTVKELKAAAWYNGQPPYGLRGFVGDMQSRVMGYGVLRQIRVKPNSCRVHPAVLNLTQECAQGSIFVNEDDTDYCNAWEEKTVLTELLPSCLRPEFKYTTASELNSMPYNAYMDSYGGGGYVYRIKGSSKAIRESLKDLQQQRWVNNHTRAIFLEFSVYNANVNLFGIATIIAEFIPGGGIMPYWRFDPIRLLHYHESTGPFLMFCEAVFMLYILFFTYKFMRDLKSSGCSAYFKSYWNMFDIIIIFAAFGAIAIYAYRTMLTRELLDTFVETKGNGYMKLQYVGLFDEYYVYLMSLILFVANIKMIKLLRFNNRFSQLILTLQTSWEDLSGFLVIFFLVFFSFVQLFYTILQSNMREFHSIIAALETCFTMMLNKFKFGNMKETSMTAAVMFFFFAVSCSWILINVMLTIIIGAYEKVNAELQARGNEYDILDFLKTHGHYVLGTKELPPRDNALADDLTDSRKQENDSSDEFSSSDDDTEDNTNQLNEKVDSFLTYINDVYFDGELDVRSKALLRPGRRVIFNSSDASGTSPIIERKARFQQ